MPTTYFILIIFWNKHIVRNYFVKYTLYRDTIRFGKCMVVGIIRQKSCSII